MQVDLPLFGVVHLAAARMGALMLGFAQKGGMADLVAARPKVLLALGAELFSDTTLSPNNIACAGCHIGPGGEDQGYEDTFLTPYPHRVAMGANMFGMEQVHADEMVQMCMVVPMAAEALEAGLVTFAPDELDWEDEVRIAVEARAALSPDALSSIAYANQEIYLGLVVAGVAALNYSLPIALAIAALLAVLTLSYSQTILAYPTGGGSYTVARENLGVWPGLVAAAALLIDYVLTAAVSLTAGVAAIASANSITDINNISVGQVLIIP